MINETFKKCIESYIFIRIKQNIYKVKKGKSENKDKNKVSYELEVQAVLIIAEEISYKLAKINANNPTKAPTFNNRLILLNLAFSCPWTNDKINA
ncbi:MAG: hypothetical protein GF383_11075, partial [Candidatus Lokiarchaeota archaeon]|nr:hypothetical protein [Candidatus Lokiarchaeota archaeon]MBD3341156.1 hypothetical protein [Candidatus Lokiarchaeota archaeon]